MRTLAGEPLLPVLLRRGVLFQHRQVFDRFSLTSWRQRMGEERLQALLQESLAVATKTKAIKPSDLNCIIVDTTIQPKNVMFPTDARLTAPARSWCGLQSGTASRCGNPMRGCRACFLTTLRRSCVTASQGASWL
jgi:hypothetical protein